KKMKRILTLCIIYQDRKILLGMKKRGFGVGKWNGFGGHVEEAESTEEAVKREVFEEAGLKVKSLEKMGVIIFEFQDGHQSFEVHIFRSKDFEGEITESEEMKPEWFYVDKLPLDNMWPADAHWLPIMLKGKKFEGKFIYDHPSTADYSSKIIKKNLREMNEAK
ncbi:MAG: 8-oxo-dGTP diphosphatase, partial [Patescibacteria group bacterium]